MEQSAKLRAKLEHRDKQRFLLVSNEGAARAQNISIKIAGTPILEHRIVPGGEEVRQLGPGGEACYMLALTSGSPLSVPVEISWSDEAGAAQNWISDVALI